MGLVRGELQTSGRWSLRAAVAAGAFACVAAWSWSLVPALVLALFGLALLSFPASGARRSRHKAVFWTAWVLNTLPLVWYLFVELVLGAGGELGLISGPWVWAGLVIGALLPFAFAAVAATSRRRQEADPEADLDGQPPHA